MIIDKDTKLYGSFAKEAGSVGCAFFNEAFERQGINAIYKSFSVDNIENAVRAAKTLDMGGFAVAAPFKYRVLLFVDDTSTTAFRCGFANTVINTGGIWIAHNTDYLAARKVWAILLDEIEYWAGVCIIGNGGYAAAVSTAALEFDIDYMEVTRDSWDRLSVIDRDWLVWNCTPAVFPMDRKLNKVIESAPTTMTGNVLARLQASYQFKLYTGLKMPDHLMPSLKPLLP